MDILAVYVGLDYHSDSIQVCVMAENGEVLLNRSVASEVGCVVEAVRSASPAILVRGVAIEACTGSAEFAARLREATEWNVRLAHASAVHQLKKGPDKSDHTDAWHLANLIRVNYLPEVWLADAETRQLRHMVRYRQSLMADAKDIKLRIRSLLKEDGVAETCRERAWTKSWLEWLKQAALPEQSRWIVEQQLDLLSKLEQKIREVDQRLDQTTKDDTTVQKLLEEEGIGLVTAMLLRAVVGRFDRFCNGKQRRKRRRAGDVQPRRAANPRRQLLCLPWAGLLDTHGGAAARYSGGRLFYTAERRSDRGE